MKRFALVFFVAFVLPSIAVAQRAPEIPIYPLGVVINAGTLDAAVNTGWIDMRGYKLLMLRFNLDRVAATAIAMTCTENDTAIDTGAGTIQKIEGATSTDFSVSKAVSGDKIWPWRVDINGFSFVKCTVTNTSGGVTDLLTVTASKARGE